MKLAPIYISIRHSVNEAVLQYGMRIIVLHTFTLTSTGCLARTLTKERLAFIYRDKQP